MPRKASAPPTPRRWATFPPRPSRIPGSGTAAPDDRPGLGPALASLDEGRADILIAASLSRIGRKVVDGRIQRLDGWKPPQKPFRVFVKKADLVPEEIEREVARHRAGANLLHVKPVGDYGLWSMQDEEVPRVAEFLAGRHVDRTVVSSKPVARRDSVAKRHRYEKLRERYPNAYESWSARDDRELLRLHEDGWGIPELARRFGRQPSAIKSRLRKLKG